MKVLFIFKSNIGRSQMAEAFFVYEAKEHTAFSAGTNVRKENEGKAISIATKKVVTCMKDVGFNVENAVMNQLTQEMVDEADKVIAITPKETLPEYLKNSSRLEIWDIPDAGGTDMGFHIKVRDMVRENVLKLVKSI